MGSNEAGGAGDKDGVAGTGALLSRTADFFLPIRAAPRVAAEGSAGRGGGGRRGEEKETDDENQEQGGP